jgi:hypothetical protein
MLRYARGQVLIAEIAGDRDIRRAAHKALGAIGDFEFPAMAHQAHRVSFSNVRRRPGYLYVRNRAISSRVNDNYDHFGAEQLAEEEPGLGWKTFIGRPVFVNHHNADHRRTRGVNIAAALHQDHNPDGTPDTWVELLKEVDPKAYPKLAAALVKGKIDMTSMGCDVGLSICSVPTCANRATTEEQLCHHMTRMKGARFSELDPKTGRMRRGLIYEICGALKFFEDSFLAEPAADNTAFVLAVEDLR